VEYACIYYSICLKVTYKINNLLLHLPLHSTYRIPHMDQISRTSSSTN